MNKEQVIATLRAHEPELKSAGILPLSLFGFVERGDMVDLENRLAAILGAPVDLAPAQMLKELVRENAVREAVVAF